MVGAVSAPRRLPSCSRATATCRSMCACPRPRPPRPRWRSPPRWRSSSPPSLLLSMPLCHCLPSGPGVGRYCEGSRVPGKLLLGHAPAVGGYGAAPQIGRRVTQKAPVRAGEWMGQAGPRRRPQPSIAYSQRMEAWRRAGVTFDRRGHQVDLDNSVPSHGSVEESRVGRYGGIPEHLTEWRRLYNP